MILAEKIMTLRKRAGWSQEELAAQLGVSRQSVSKWEGAQSVPDMQKVVQMSRLFGVTTDYLLKEELGEPEPAQSEPDAPLRCVTMEQAADYLSLRRAAAPKLAAATLLCVLSPVALLLLAALSDRPGAAISEKCGGGHRPVRAAGARGGRGGGVHHVCRAGESICLSGERTV